MTKQETLIQELYDRCTEIQKQMEYYQDKMNEALEQVQTTHELLKREAIDFLNYNQQQKSDDKDDVGGVDK